MWRTKGLLPCRDHTTIPALDVDCLSSLHLLSAGDQTQGFVHARPALPTELRPQPSTAYSVQGPESCIDFARARLVG